jgi:hypothetical protein
MRVLCSSSTNRLTRGFTAAPNGDVVLTPVLA